MLDIAFHRTSTRPIPRKLVTPPLGVITTFCQSHDAASSLPLKAACIIATTFLQFHRLGSSSRFAAQFYIRMCSAFNPEGLLEQCSQIRITSSEISSSPGIVSSIRKGCTLMVIGLLGNGTYACRSTCFEIRASGDMRSGRRRKSDPSITSLRRTHPLSERHGYGCRGDTRKWMMA